MIPWSRHGIFECLNNTQERFNASAADKLRSKLRPSCADHGSEMRLSVNWKYSANAFSLRRVIGKEISRSSKKKKYKVTHEDKGTKLNMIIAGRWDNTKHKSDWGNTVILTKTNSPLSKNVLIAIIKCVICHIQETFLAFGHKRKVKKFSFSCLVWNFLGILGIY